MNETLFLFQVFETLPDTVQEIDELICEEQSRLNCQFETDPQVNLRIDWLVG